MHHYGCAGVCCTGDAASWAARTPLALIFYELLKPVNRNLVLLAIFFALVSITISAVNLISHFARTAVAAGARLNGALVSIHYTAGL